MHCAGDSTTALITSYALAMESTWVRKPTAECSVVYVHGILSGSETAWGDSGRSWPLLLADEEELADIGIYAFSYLTGIFTGNYSLGDVVDALKEQMRLDDVLQSRNVVFVCHSMGGIIVRQYLVSRQ